MTVQSVTGFVCLDAGSERKDMVSQSLQEIHDQCLAAVMSHEPGGSFDYLLQGLPEVSDLGDDPTVGFKLFMPGTGCRWYILAGHDIGGDWILHCYATGPDHEKDEFGYVSLNDLLRSVRRGSREVSQ